MKNVICILSQFKKIIKKKKEVTWYGSSHGEWQTKEMNVSIFYNLGTSGFFE